MPKTDALNALAGSWPWPAERPHADPAGPAEPPDPDASPVLARELSGRTRSVVEVGPGGGRTTLRLAGLAPEADLIAVGAGDGDGGEERAFFATCWPIRDRVILVRLPALEGLQAVADAGLRPDAVCLQGRGRGGLAAEVEVCLVVFPGAVVMGDGHDRPDVAGAVALAAKRHGLAVESRGDGWALVPRARPWPWPVDERAAAVERPAPRFVTFPDPGPGTGAWVVARIVEELERVRPDVPVLIVGEGPARALDGCGLDLRARKNLLLAVAAAGDARRRWAETRVALLPWLDWGHPATAAVEAAVNGVPVVGSDRGALPEAVGEGGVILPLPGRLQPGTRWRPSAEEVEPWVRAVVRVWDDPEWRGALARAARDGVGRRRVGGGLVRVPSARSALPHESVVLVPHLHGIEPGCEDGLRRLERAGVKVVRTGGCSAIDSARSQMASDALRDGFEALLFVDADISFDPEQALALLARPEPVVAGVYAKKNVRALTCEFADGIDEVVFGAGAPGVYPLKYASAGFLRVRAEVLRAMIEALDLPLCNAAWGRGLWPFFLPMIVPHPSGSPHYLGEDWSFSARLERVGVTPLADTTVRLFHLGRHGFGWEDAGTRPLRYRSFRYRIGEDPPAAPRGPA